MHTRLSLFLSVALAATGTLAAQPQLLVPLTPTKSSAPSRGAMPSRKTARAEPTAAQKQARAFRRPQVSGRALSRAVSKVTRKLKWHKKLADAQQTAVQSGKPIVWIQALGDITRYT